MSGVRNSCETVRGLILCIEAARAARTFGAYSRRRGVRDHLAEPAARARQVAPAGHVHPQRVVSCPVAPQRGRRPAGWRGILHHHAALSRDRCPREGRCRHDSRVAASRRTHLGGRGKAQVLFSSSPQARLRRAQCRSSGLEDGTRKKNGIRTRSGNELGAAADPSSSRTRGDHVAADGDRPIVSQPDEEQGRVY